jgi:hypothetical protein
MNLKAALLKVEENMSTVGQIEKKTQERVVKLFCDTLGYDYLGNWIAISMPAC